MASSRVLVNFAALVAIIDDDELHHEQPSCVAILFRVAMTEVDGRLCAGNCVSRRRVENLLRWIARQSMYLACEAVSA